MVKKDLFFAVPPVHEPPPRLRARVLIDDHDRGQLVGMFVLRGAAKEDGPPRGRRCEYLAVFLVPPHGCGSTEFGILWILVGGHGPVALLPAGPGCLEGVWIRAAHFAKRGGHVRGWGLVESEGPAVLVKLLPLLGFAMLIDVDPFMFNNWTLICGGDGIWHDDAVADPCMGHAGLARFGYGYECDTVTQVHDAFDITVLTGPGSLIGAGPGGDPGNIAGIVLFGIVVLIGCIGMDKAGSLCASGKGWQRVVIIEVGEYGGGVTIFHDAVLIVEGIGGGGSLGGGTVDDAGDFFAIFIDEPFRKGIAVSEPFDWPRPAKKADHDEANDRHEHEGCQHPLLYPCD